MKMGNNISTSFKVTKGLNQGCCLSRTLYKICVQEILKIWRRKYRGLGIYKKNDCLNTTLFADNQVVFSNDAENISYLLRKLREGYLKWGMKINLRKRDTLWQVTEKRIQLQRHRGCKIVISTWEHLLLRMKSVKVDYQSQDW